MPIIKGERKQLCFDKLTHVSFLAAIQMKNSLLATVGRYQAHPPVKGDVFSLELVMEFAPWVQGEM